MLKYVAEGAGYGFSILTTIGRAGMVFLGMKTSLSTITPLSSAGIYTIAAIGSTAIVVSYGSIFTIKLHELLNKIIEFFNGFNSEENASNPDKETSKIIDYLGNTLGWIIGITTASVEGMVTFVGWGTWFHVLSVPIGAADTVAAILGVSSVAGWMGLIGMPTARIFHRITKNTLSLCIPNNSPEDSAFFDIRHPFVWGVGMTIACVSAIGSGSIGFFATEHVMNTFGFEGLKLLLPSIAGVVTFCSTGALYVIAIPGSFQDLYQSLLKSTNKTNDIEEITEENNNGEQEQRIFRGVSVEDHSKPSELLGDINPASDSTTGIPEEPKQTASLSNYATISFGVVNIALTAGATYLLGYTAISNMLENVAPNEMHNAIVPLSHTLGICLGIGASAISGRAGYNLINNPSLFFKTINKSYHKNFPEQDEEKKSLVINDIQPRTYSAK